MEGYIKVLDLYCKDAAKRLEILSNVPDEKNLVPFTTQVHALKSASASIGAEEISRLAAELEEAGKHSRLDFIGAELAAFREHLSGLVGRIRLALAEYAHDSENEVTDGELSLKCQEALSRLRNALLSENVGKIDALLKEFEAMSIGSKTKETLSEVAGLALTSEFADAAGMIDGLIKKDLR